MQGSNPLHSFARLQAHVVFTIVFAVSRTAAARLDLVVELGGAELPQGGVPALFKDLLLRSLLGPFSDSVCKSSHGGLWIVRTLQWKEQCGCEKQGQRRRFAEITFTVVYGLKPRAGTRKPIRSTTLSPINTSFWHPASGERLSNCTSAVSRQAMAGSTPA